MINRGAVVFAVLVAFAVGYELRGRMSAPPSAVVQKPPSQSTDPAGIRSASSYTVGHVYGGLTYLGGDINKPASWYSPLCAAQAEEEHHKPHVVQTPKGPVDLSQFWK